MSHKDKKSLTYQVQETLKEKTAYGKSKHIDKANGTSKENIYSYNTFKTYMKMCNHFTDYCKENYKCKDLEQCEKYVNDYIQHRRNEDGVSAYTQKAELSAIGKLYGKSFFDSVETDVRHRSEITRSRMDTARSRHFSEEKNAELINFCKCTGLRRSELENIKGDCLIQKEDGNFYIHVEGGKGGKNRDVYILGQDEQVINKIQNTNDDDKVWGRVHNGADIHSYRADYATSLYEELARDVDTLDRSERYDCRKDLEGTSWDKKAMLEVSQNLGHNRIDVIAQSYLRR